MVKSPVSRTQTGKKKPAMKKKPARKKPTQCRYELYGWSCDAGGDHPKTNFVQHGNAFYEPLGVSVIVNSKTLYGTKQTMRILDEHDRVDSGLPDHPDPAHLYVIGEFTTIARFGRTVIVCRN